MGGYLFTYFTGEHRGGEQIYFSVSKDGLHWEDLNQGKPVLKSHKGTNGVRDPFLVKNPETEMYYLIATDLCIEADGNWEKAKKKGSCNIVVWQSEDLLHWGRQKLCSPAPPEASCLWAPEAVYDKVKKAFFVYWASWVQDPNVNFGKHKIYSAYTTDFIEFTKPEIYLEKKSDIIDTTIIEKEGRFYRISKNEKTSQLFIEKSDYVNGEYMEVKSYLLNKKYGLEGPICYCLPDKKTWCLLADQYAEGKGYLPLLVKDFERGKLEMLERNQYSMGTNCKRHGGIIEITDEQLQNLHKNL